MAPDAAATDAIRDLYDDLQIEGDVLDLGGFGLDHFNVPPDTLSSERDALDAFDAVVYFGAPDDAELFAGIAQVLKPGGMFVATFTNRTAPDTAKHVRRLRQRFERTAGFGPAESDLRTSLTGAGDQLWALWAAKR